MALTRITTKLIEDSTITNADISASFVSGISGSFTQDMTLATASIAAITSSVSTINDNMTLATASIAAITSSVSTINDNMTLATASIAAITASLGQPVNTDSDVTFGTVSSGDITSTGTITAVEVHTTYVSSSIAVASGSNNFGDDTSDHHSFTGSLSVSGSLYATGSSTIEGDISIFDNGRINFGDANDLKIYHSGDHSIIQDTGTGDLKVRASITRIMGTTDSDNQGVFTQGEGVELYYDNSKKLDVVTGGVDVTGALTATGNVSSSITSTGSFGSVVAGGTGVSSFTGGNVGIGTTSPDSQLHVVAAGSPSIRVTDSTNTVTGKFQADDNVGKVGTHTNHPFVLFANNTEVMRVSGSGVVGIGTTAASSFVEADDLTIGNTTGGHGLSIISSNQKSSSLYFGESTVTMTGGITYNNSDQHMYFRTGNVHNQVSINNTGMLGVGTTDAAQAITISHSEPSMLFIHEHDGTSTEIGFIGDVANFLTGGSPGSADFGVRAAGDFRIGTGGNNLRMTVDASGSVGIGTETPGETVHIYSTGGVGLKLESDGMNLAIIDIKSDHSSYGNGLAKCIRFWEESTVIAGIGVPTAGTHVDDLCFYSLNSDGSDSSGNPGGDPLAKLHSGGDWYTNDGSVSNLSDKRGKKDITDLEDGLDIVNKLKPVTYKYNGKVWGADDNVKRYGFVADDILEVASQYVKIQEGTVDGEEVDDLKSISMMRMFPMLVKAVQELSEKNEALEKRIEELKK